MTDVLTFAKKALGVTLYPGQAEALAAYYMSGKPGWLFLSGRRGGKSLLSDIVACYEAIVPDFSDYLRPGEERHVLITSVRQDNARLHIRTIERLLRHTREIGRLVTRELEDRIELANGVVILSMPASARAGRGFTASTVIHDELAHYVDGEGNSSADAVFDAYAPTSATFGDMARVIIPTTPAARSGIVYDLFERSTQGLLDDWHVTRMPTVALNPKVGQRTIDRARQRDAESAAVEYDAEFREPVEAFLDGEKLQAAIDKKRRRVESAVQGVSYAMAVDPAVMQDRYGFLIGHREGLRVVVDYANLMHPPVNPAAAEDLLRDLVRRFHPTVIRTDSAALVQRLKHELPALQYDPFTRPKKLRWYGALKELVNLERLDLYPEKDLLEELGALQIRNGVDISAPKAGRVTHDDLADCLALVCDRLSGGGGGASAVPNVFFDERFWGEDGMSWVTTSDGRYVIIPKANKGVQHELTAEAVAACRHRAAGCPSCVAYFDATGEIAAERELAEEYRTGARVPLSDAELARTMAEAAGYGPDDLRRRAAEDRAAADFRATFMRGVRRDIERSKR